VQSFQEIRGLPLGDHETGDMDGIHSALRANDWTADGKLSLDPGKKDVYSSST
ncbi:uncharacterized protein METZ01_LOCUS220410, partial [marine metagenome]